jgi:uncharacterized protein (TIGR00375 family)
MENFNRKELMIADLHLHSRFSRACSNALTIPNLVKWARIKGLDILGTGDFTHEVWLGELKKYLKDNGKGIFYYEDEKGKFPFILTHEISLIYTDLGKGRKVHLLYFAPNFEVVGKINSWLDTLGRRDYDGRPIFKITCRDFAAKMEEIDPRIEIIPAHAWTPFFGIFGSQGGYNSLEEAFKDKVNRIHAIETGISSDPAMNWKIKTLENKSIVSFSDSHSFWPHRLGREATIFYKFDSFEGLIKQIRENSFFGTIETDPAYGKYHFDGHRDCNFSCSPEKSKELKNICPVCHKPLTIGVDNRVNEISAPNQEKNYLKKKGYFTVLPVHEIISLFTKTALTSKAVEKIFNEMIEKFPCELYIVLEASEEELENAGIDKKLIKLIIKNRLGKIKVKPGYDGEYGVAMLENIEGEQNALKKEHKFQTKLF